jgi:hypothetical protein
VLSGGATNTHLIVFGLTQPGLEPTIYRTQAEHATLKVKRLKNKIIKQIWEQEYQRA